MGCVCLFLSNSLESRAEQITESVQRVAGFFLMQVTIIYWHCLMLYLMFAEAGETKRKIAAVAGRALLVFTHDSVYRHPGHIQLTLQLSPTQKA